MKKRIITMFLLITMLSFTNGVNASELDTPDVYNITTEERVVLPDGTIITEVTFEDMIKDLARVNGTTYSQELQKHMELNPVSLRSGDMLMTATSTHYKKIEHPETIYFGLIGATNMSYYNTCYVSYEIRGPGINVNILGVHSIYTEAYIDTYLFVSFDGDVISSSSSYWGDTVSWSMTGSYTASWTGIGGAQTVIEYFSYTDVVM